MTSTINGTATIHGSPIATPTQDMRIVAAAGGAAVDDCGYDTAYPRLVFSPRHPGLGEMDGRWWPRTRDLAVELPALVVALAHRFGPVDRVSLDPEAWNSRPRTITIDDRVILLDWFGTRQRHTIGLFGPHSSRFDLLAIPPDTATIVAVACLTMQTPAETSTEREQRNRWEDDGGRTGCAVPQVRGGEV